MPAIVDFRCIIDPKTFKIEVRASKPISKGDEITTRYFTPWEGQPARREHIKTHWGFICKCHRCKSPSDLDTNFRFRFFGTVMHSPHCCRRLAFLFQCHKMR